MQPTPIYETLSMGLIAWWLWCMRERFRPGALFAFYLVLSGTERLLVEFVRRNHRVWAGLTAPGPDVLPAGSVVSAVIERGARVVSTVKLNEPLPAAVVVAM